MGIYIMDDAQRIEIRTCLGNGCGCVQFSKNEHVYVSIRDRCKDNIVTELSVTLKKREGYDEIIHEIYKGISAFWNEPRADEDEMLKALKYVEDKLKHVKYVGVKLEYTSQRGFEIKFRLRYSEKEKQYINVELIAEKDGEKLTYYAYGGVNDYRLLLEEAAKAIAAYVLFSDFISRSGSS
jgi:hypothetical protein